MLEKATQVTQQSSCRHEMPTRPNSCTFVLEKKVCVSRVDLREQQQKNFYLMKGWHRNKRTLLPKCKPPLAVCKGELGVGSGFASRTNTFWNVILGIILHHSKRLKRSGLCCCCIVFTNAELLGIAAGGGDHSWIGHMRTNSKHNMQNMPPLPDINQARTKVNLSTSNMWHYLPLACQPPPPPTARQFVAKSGRGAKENCHISYFSGPPNLQYYKSKIVAQPKCLLVKKNQAFLSLDRIFPWIWVCTFTHQYLPYHVRYDWGRMEPNVIVIPIGDLH